MDYQKRIKAVPDVHGVGLDHKFSFTMAGEVIIESHPVPLAELARALDGLLISFTLVSWAFEGQKTGV